MMGNASFTRSAAAFAVGAAWWLPLVAQTDDTASRYRLTPPSVRASPEADAAGQSLLLSAGQVQLAAGETASGRGLSLQAGQQWFARLGIGRGMDSELSVGGGYRFAGGNALSMHVTRQLGQERLGLAVRYDWAHAYYLRLSYDTRLGPAGPGDTLRFSAGLRF